MAYTIPYGEPSAARAGDTWQWKLSLADFPADSWTLTYILHNASARVAIVASASGADHLVSVSASTTGDYTAGRYDWIARVTDGSETYTVGSGQIQVLPALTAAYDGRSHARIMLDAIESILEGRATNNQIDLVSTAFGDRSVGRDRSILLQARSRYAAEVRAEDEARRLASGERPSRLVQVKFTG